jgi:single-strand DNA-binding protein
MASLNKVFLIGNLTKDPELRFVPSGSAVGTLSMAINRKYKTQDGQMKDDVCYVNVTVWGKQAEACSEFLSKGSPLLVEGRLRYKKYETDDGQKRSVMDVVAERVQFLGKKKTAAGDSVDETASSDEVPSEPGSDSEEKPPF